MVQLILEEPRRYLSLMKLNAGIVLLAALVLCASLTFASVQVGNRFPLGIAAGGGDVNCTVEAVDILQFVNGSLIYCNGTDWLPVNQDLIDRLNELQASEGGGFSSSELRDVRKAVERQNLLSTIEFCNFHGEYDETQFRCVCHCDATLGCWDASSRCSTCMENDGWTGEDCLTDTASPVVTIHAPSVITIEAGDVYDLPTVTAWDNKDLELTNIVASGLLSGTDPMPYDFGEAFLRVGFFVVRFDTVDAAGNAAFAEQTVHVEDTTPPVLTLDGDSVVTTEAGESYSDAGASVTDNQDLPAVIQSNVSSIPLSNVGVYVVEYMAVDASGNDQLAPVHRTVHVVDTRAPVVSLLGPQTVTWTVGVSYSDDGATASDVAGIDSSLITVCNTGDVDTSVPGTVQLNISSTDDSGNTGYATRTVVVMGATANSFADTLFVASGETVSLDTDAQSVHSYYEVMVEEGGTLTGTGSNPLILDVVEDVNIFGTVDISGADGQNGRDVTVSSGGGAGGGALKIMAKRIVLHGTGRIDANGGDAGDTGPVTSSGTEVKLPANLESDGLGGVGRLGGYSGGNGGGPSQLGQVGSGPGGGGVGANDNGLPAGSGGGGFGTAGTPGDASRVAAGAGGAAYGDAQLTVLQGGSGGGGGTNDPDNEESPGGGGAGGAVWLSACEVVVHGSITAIGGTGGQDDYVPESNNGGSGGNGRVRIDSDVTITPSGATISPSPYTATGSCNANVTTPSTLFLSGSISSPVLINTDRYVAIGANALTVTNTGYIRGYGSNPLRFLVENTVDVFGSIDVGGFDGDYSRDLRHAGGGGGGGGVLVIAAGSNVIVHPSGDISANGGKGGSAQIGDGSYAEINSRRAGSGEGGWGGPGGNAGGHGGYQPGFGSSRVGSAGEGLGGGQGGEVSGGVPGGSGGGGFGTSGEQGHFDYLGTTTMGQGGSAYGDVFFTQLLGGSGGAGGTVDGSDNEESGGGGGSGGAILLRGSSVSIQGQVQSVGGAGGLDDYGPNVNDGGNGGNGRIRVDGSLALTGSVSPSSAYSNANTDTCGA